MNILLVAYACEPDKGSEPAVGWNISLELSKELECESINVVTRRNNKKTIEKTLYPKNLNFIYYDLPKYLSWWKKGPRFARIYYYLWMIGATLKIKKMKINFDIIHHITFVNDWLPSFFIFLKTKNTKFIWGPIGSNDLIDKKFIFNKKSTYNNKLSNLLRTIFRKFDPFFIYTKNNANVIIGINEETREKLNLKDTVSFFKEPAIGINEDELRGREEKGDNKYFNIISVGNFIDIKNFHTIILAFSTFINNLDNDNREFVRLNIVGDGVNRKSLEDYSIKLNTKKYINFKGKLSLSETLKEFDNANLFLYATLENAGFVFLEAMQKSLPIVALNIGGAKSFIQDNKDLQLVDTKLEYDEIINNMSLKLFYFFDNENIRIKVGFKNHLGVIENFLWSNKVKKYIKIYKELSNER